MRILFLGSFPTTKLIKESDGAIDSLYRDDNAIIDGLRKIPSVKVEVLTIPDIPSYPKQKLFIKGYYDCGDDVRSLPLLNLPVIKQLWTILILFIFAFNYLWHHKEIIYIFVPYIVFHHTLPARLLKILFCSRVKVITVVPDIFFPKSKILKWLNKKAENNTKKSDGYVLYTESMRDYLRINDKSYIVIEGFQCVTNRKTEPQDDAFRIVYCGSLNLSYGIGRLIDSMKFITAPVELHLYGAGTAVSYAKEAALKDSRIVYKGKVSKEEAQKAVSRATVLVNPRNSTDGEYVNYSFPSKDIEYLGSGIPTILCKLPGMPKQYYGFFIDAFDGSPENLANAINRVYSMSERERTTLGQSARTFILERMDTQKQAERIVGMLKRIY